MKVYQQPIATVARWQWGDPLLRHLTDTILRMLDPTSQRVLEVGCGTGRLAIALARRGHRVVAIDIVPDVVDCARQLGSEMGVAVDFRLGDLVEMRSEIGEAAYDLIICSEVLEHLAQPELLIDAMAGALKPGGTLVVTVPNDPRQFSVLDRHAGHLRRYRWEDLRQTLARFEIETAFTVGFPFTRLVHALYTRLLLPLLFREHRPENLWRQGSAYPRFGAEVLYRLARLDNLFNSSRRGTTWVVKARKRAPARLAPT